LYHCDDDEGDDSSGITEMIIPVENTDDIEDYDDGDDSRQGKSPDDPYDECFGSIIVSTRRINDKS
jgi:hypothetical protein